MEILGTYNSMYKLKKNNWGEDLRTYVGMGLFASSVRYRTYHW